MSPVGLEFLKDFFPEFLVFFTDSVLFARFFSCLPKVLGRTFISEPSKILDGSRFALTSKACRGSYLFLVVVGLLILSLELVEFLILGAVTLQQENVFALLEVHLFRLFTTFRKPESVSLFRAYCLTTTGRMSVAFTMLLTTINAIATLAFKVVRAYLTLRL